MPATRQDLFARLDALAIATSTVDHPPVFTVAESGALRGRLPGAHTKNLFLRDKKGRQFLIVARDETEVDLKGLHKRIGCGRLFANAGHLMRSLGVAPGSVTPFAVINDTDNRVAVILDEALLSFDPLNFHPLANDATTAIARDDLLRFLRDCGHEPRVMSLSPPSSEDGDAESGNAR